MKKFIRIAFAAILVAATAVCCTKPESEDDQKSEDVAPIIVNVVMPTQANALPGTDVTIKGVGFMQGDIIKCAGQEGQGDFTPTVKSVSNADIVIAVPEDACGKYQVSVTRKEKTTVLSEILTIAKVEKIENIVLPTAVVKWGETLTITADGIKATDVVSLESENYSDVVIEGAASENKVSFKVPNTIWGANTVKIIRGESVTPLGTVKIGATTMTNALGGIVYYISDEGQHGLVVYPECVVPDATIWGPSIPRDPYDAGTEDGIYKGASNTEKLVNQYNNVMNDGTFSYAAKSPAVVCSELSVNGYDDWFLPSKAELSELFYVKNTLAEKGLFTIPANNYWTSCEFHEEAPSWDWAMWYVNFYEATDLVTWCAAVDGWAIGAMAVRMF